MVSLASASLLPLSVCFPSTPSSPVSFSYRVSPLLFFSIFSHLCSSPLLTSSSLTCTPLFSLPHLISPLPFLHILTPLFPVPILPLPFPFIQMCFSSPLSSHHHYSPSFFPPLPPPPFTFCLLFHLPSSLTHPSYSLISPSPLIPSPLIVPPSAQWKQLFGVATGKEMLDL